MLTQLENYSPVSSWKRGILQSQHSTRGDPINFGCLPMTNNTDQYLQETISLHSWHEPCSFDKLDAWSFRTISCIQDAFSVFDKGNQWYLFGKINCLRHMHDPHTHGPSEKGRRIEQKTLEEKGRIRKFSAGEPLCEKREKKFLGASIGGVLVGTTLSQKTAHKVHYIFQSGQLFYYF